MSNEGLKEEKKFMAKNEVDKPFKSNVEGLVEACFESGTVKHAAQFTKMLEEIANYVQKITTATPQK